VTRARPAVGHRTRARFGGAIVIAVAASLLAGAVGCSSGGSSPTGPDEPASHRGGVLRLGLTGTESLDPASVVPTDHGQMITADLLYDALTEATPDGLDVRPSLASDWSSDDQLTTWTFNLRADARFSDGSQVTAADVKYSLERVASFGAATVSAARLDVIAGYGALAVDKTATALSGLVADGDRTLKVTLARPYAELAALLGSPLFGVVKKPAGSEGFATVGNVGGVPITSGPYRIGERSGDTLRLERADGGAAAPDEVDLVRFAAPTAAYDAFAAGKVDWSLVPADKLADAEARFGTGQFRTFEAILWWGMNLNAPTYQSLGLRQALVKAANRPALVAKVLPGERVLNGLVAVGVPGEPEDACGLPCHYDPEGAKALLASAYPDGSLPTIQLDFYDDPTQAALADGLKSDFEAVGLGVELHARPFAEYRSAVISGDQQVFSFGWVAVPPIADEYLAPLFGSDSADNVTGFSSPDVDALFGAARADRDPAKRQAAYLDAEQRVLAQAPVLPLAQYSTNAVVGERVQDFRARIDGTFDVNAVWLSGDAPSPGTTGG